MLSTAYSRAVKFGIVLLGVSLMPALRAGTIWTSWTSATMGTPGSASGNLNGVTVSYNGEVNGYTVINGTSNVWSNPASSFIGGTSTTSPSTVGDVIAEDGSFAGTNTLTFSTPVVDPLIALWSLGTPRILAGITYTFMADPTFEAGGPDIYPGSMPISVNGQVVTAQEGSGVLQFNGTFSQISWTDTYENYYGFTVGGNFAPSQVTPEPGTLALFGAGFTGLALLLRRRKSA